MFCFCFALIVSQVAFIEDNISNWHILGSLPLMPEVPWKFHTLKVELVDCSVLLNQSPSSENKSVSIKLISESSDVSMFSNLGLWLKKSGNKRHGNKRKTMIYDRSNYKLVFKF